MVPDHVLTDLKVSEELQAQSGGTRGRGEEGLGEVPRGPKRAKGRGRGWRGRGHSRSSKGPVRRRDVDHECPFTSPPRPPTSPPEVPPGPRAARDPATRVERCGTRVGASLNPPPQLRAFEERRSDPASPAAEGLVGESSKPGPSGRRDRGNVPTSTPEWVKGRIYLPSPDPHLQIEV